jgi:hypothetical protein
MEYSHHDMFVVLKLFAERNEKLRDVRVDITAIGSSVL